MTILMSWSVLTIYLIVSYFKGVHLLQFDSTYSTMWTKSIGHWIYLCVVNCNEGFYEMAENNQKILFMDKIERSIEIRRIYTTLGN